MLDGPFGGNVFGHDSKQGFATYTEKDIRLQATQVYAVSPALSIGTVANRVEVSAAGVQVQTSTSEISTSVSQQEVETLPLNGRNFQSLSALMPGVTNTAPDTAQVQGGFLQVNTMSVGGLATTGTMYYVDGIWNMNTGDMLQLTITPNPDTIAEVRVLQNNYSAQYSLFGGNVVLLQTRSGTEPFMATRLSTFATMPWMLETTSARRSQHSNRISSGIRLAARFTFPVTTTKTRLRRSSSGASSGLSSISDLRRLEEGRVYPHLAARLPTRCLVLPRPQRCGKALFSMPITDPVTGAAFSREPDPGKSDQPKMR